MSQLNAAPSIIPDFESPSNLLDEKYWHNFQQQFHLDEDVINFRANGASPVPNKVLEFFEREFRNIQSVPSMKNKGIMAGEKEALRVSLATAVNCSVKEIAIMRNTTEALNNVLMGFRFNKGDEVIASVHEYDSMMGSLHQRRLTDGITIKTINIPYQPQSKEEIIDLFEKSITAKTKMFLISHIVWISGQIYPVKELCTLARKYNIVTVIDAAQSFSHIPVDVEDIGCDFLATSLHKWCAAPLGTGFLYARKNMISKTYPLMGCYQHLPDSDAIEKFEETGTITPVFNAVNVSLQFWEKLGYAVKTQRMQILKEYAAQQIKELPGISIRTNIQAEHSCGILYFEIKDKSAAAVRDHLWNKHRITVQAIEKYKNDYVDYKGVNTLGIGTPVFITLSTIDKLTRAVKELL